MCPVDGKSRLSAGEALCPSLPARCAGQPASQRHRYAENVSVTQAEAIYRGATRSELPSVHASPQEFTFSAQPSVSSSRPSRSAFSYLSMTRSSHKDSPPASTPLGTPCLMPSKTGPMQSSQRLRRSISMRAESPISHCLAKPAAAAPALAAALGLGRPAVPPPPPPPPPWVW